VGPADVVAVLAVGPVVAFVDVPRVPPVPLVVASICDEHAVLSTRTNAPTRTEGVRELRWAMFTTTFAGVAIEHNGRELGK
jgi:hypothetical protein